MSSKTKIVVLRMKEIIYTGIFVGLAILLVTLCLIMFRPKKDTAGSEAASYIPGVYSASLNLGNQDVNVQVAVDANRISSVSLVPLSTQSLENLTYSSQSRYTSAALLKAIQTALDKAKIQ